jgi:hypothetical protein
MYLTAGTVMGAEQGEEAVQVYHTLDRTAVITGSDRFHASAIRFLGE